jgi:hypothetical protein
MFKSCFEHVYDSYIVRPTHRVHIFTRDETGVSVSAHSAGAYTATLLVMVNVMKGDGRAAPTLTSLG